MNSETSRKIIAAGGMAAVVLVGVVTFALRAQPTPAIAQVPPGAPGAAAEIPAAPAAVAQTPAAPAAVAHSDSVATKSADTATPRLTASSR
jgi:hypothetical protein